jgi:hypothetical protein
LEKIIDTIESCVATDTWATNGGGTAEIRSIKSGLLVISQTAAVHEEIRDLLTTIRKAHDQPVVASNETPANATADSGEVVTRSYVLQLNPAQDPEKMRSQVRELIVDSLPDEVWKGRLDDGQPVMLSVFHDRIVVRHTPAVQQKLQQVLLDAGIAAPAPATAAGFGGGMSGFGGEGMGGFGGAAGGGFGSGGFGRSFGPYGRGPGPVPGLPGAAPASQGGPGPGAPAPVPGEGGGPEGAAPGPGPSPSDTGENPFGR